MAKKKVLRGLKDLRIFPISKNDATGYEAGSGVLVQGLQSLSLEPEMTEWKIYADDTVYLSGSDWNGMKLSLQLAELPLELKMHFEGGEWDETKKEYTYKSSSIAPEIGMSFKALMSDRNYRMVKLYSLRCTKVKEDLKTKGEGDSANPVQIEGLVTARAIDEATKTEKDSTSASDFSWLESLTEPPTP